MKLNRTVTMRFFAGALAALASIGAPRAAEQHKPSVVDTTKRAIIATALKRGLTDAMEYVLVNYGCSEKDIRASIERSLRSANPRRWSAGALAAQEYPSDAFTLRLIAIANGKGIELNARLRAIYALAANRTDESVMALKALLMDSDERIRSGAKQAIDTAYHYRGCWTGRPLKPDDFDEPTSNGK